MAHAQFFGGPSCRQFSLLPLPSDTFEFPWHCHGLTTEFYATGFRCGNAFFLSLADKFSFGLCNIILFLDKMV